MPARARSRPAARRIPAFAALFAPRLLIGGALLILAVQWAHAVLRFGGAGADDVFGRWTYDAIGVLAAFACLARGVKRGPGRVAWLALGLGLTARSAGDLVYSLAPNPANVPVPSWSDPLWLAFYPAAYVALLAIARARVRGALAATRVDGVICGITAASALACASLPTALAGSAGSPFWEMATNLAYPVADLILGGAVVSAVALSGWRLDRTLVILGASIVAWEAADLMYLYSPSAALGDVADALVLTGVTGMALAATIDRPTIRGADEDRGLFVPVAFGALALAILFAGALLRAQTVALILAAIALALVLMRMARTLAENRALLRASRLEASTDHLTGLGNRRKLKADLAALLEHPAPTPMVLVLLDLNGFKAFNDTFGHGAGDTLLHRLGLALAATLRRRGEAYRMGGDEFCVLAAGTADDAPAIAGACVEALTAHGELVTVTAAHGWVAIPEEVIDSSDALSLADARMYADKARRAPGPRTPDPIWAARR